MLKVAVILEAVIPLLSFWVHEKGCEAYVLSTSVSLRLSVLGCQMLSIHSRDSFLSLMHCSE